MTIDHTKTLIIITKPGPHKMSLRNKDSSGKIHIEKREWAMGTGVFLPPIKRAKIVKGNLYIKYSVWGYPRSMLMIPEGSYMLRDKQ